jgi:hypothetical protein
VQLLGRNVLFSQPSQQIGETFGGIANNFSFAFEWVKLVQ